MYRFPLIPVFIHPSPVSFCHCVCQTVSVSPPSSPPDRHNIRCWMCTCGHQCVYSQQRIASIKLPHLCRERWILSRLWLMASDNITASYLTLFFLCPPYIWFPSQKQRTERKCLAADVATRCFWYPQPALYCSCSVDKMGLDWTEMWFMSPLHDYLDVSGGALVPFHLMEW